MSSIEEMMERAKEHLKKFTIKTDVAKQLHQALKKSCDEYQTLDQQNERLCGEQRELERKLRLLKAKIAVNEAKLRVIRLTARDEKDAWQKEMNAQPRDAFDPNLPRMHISILWRAAEELFGECFSIDKLKIPPMVAEDYDA